MEIRCLTFLLFKDHFTGLPLRTFAAIGNIVKLDADYNYKIQNNGFGNAKIKRAFFNKALRITNVFIYLTLKIKSFEIAAEIRKGLNQRGCMFLISD